ncbi:cbb3-type cytochrome c oxidase subunit II [Oleiharenicola lentus]|uniref:cbb3-type cytochrome c oxidase subunit II n=1 Tax=Oleiharenicola lentus TaxID=2508720 RepID=UPI003F67D1FB
MKNGLALFLGVFATLALSWAGLLLAAHKQIGSLSQFKDPAEETLYPQPMSGLANQGMLVYQDLGCVACHTQQVRREGVGSDLERQWGVRGGYPRDYIRDRAVLIGQNRVGPDLRNVGARLGDSAKPEEYADWFYKLLYAPESVSAGSAMPAHKFLFDVRPLAGSQPSAHAIKLTSKYAPGAGYEVVPTQRAVALVAYLQSLKDTYDYPTERGLNAPAEKKKGAH